MDIKNIIIFLIIFILIMWFQHNDDIKYKKKRINLYDKIKIPLATAIIVILLKDFDYKECVIVFQTYIKPEIKPMIDENIPLNLFEPPSINDIYIGPPNF